jgi:hypothetical protein
MKLASEIIMRGRSQPSKTMNTDRMYNILVEGFHVSIGLGNISMSPRHDGSFAE